MTNQILTRTCRRKHSVQGFSILEVVLALAVFAMMTLMFAAVVPMSVRGAQYSSNYSQAVMVAQHKMDQIRSVGYTPLLVTVGGQTPQQQMVKLGIIDATQPSGYPINSSNVTTYSFSTVDSLVSSATVHGFFPPGSTGTVTISDYGKQYPASGVPIGSLAYVTVKIAWTGAGFSNGNSSLSAIIAGGVSP